MAALCSSFIHLRILLEVQEVAGALACVRAPVVPVVEADQGCGGEDRGGEDRDGSGPDLWEAASGSIDVGKRVLSDGSCCNTQVNIWALGQVVTDISDDFRATLSVRPLPAICQVHLEAIEQTGVVFLARVSLEPIAINGTTTIAQLKFCVSFYLQQNGIYIASPKHVYWVCQS